MTPESKNKVTLKEKIISLSTEGMTSSYRKTNHRLVTSTCVAEEPGKHTSPSRTAKTFAKVPWGRR